MKRFALACMVTLFFALSATQALGNACATWSAWDSAAVAPLTQRDSLRSSTIGAQWSFLAYVPPSYATSAKRYPCLFWLHGGGGDQATGSAFVSKLDDAIRRGAAPEMIVILLQGPPQGWWIDTNGANDWPVETAFVNELVPYVDATFRTLGTREGRGIEGFSMGGCGSARFGFKYASDLFGLVSVLSGGLQDENYISILEKGDTMTCVYGCDADSNDTNCAYFQENYPFNLASINKDELQNGPRRSTYVRLAVGTADDKTYSWMAGLDSTLTSLGIAHTFQRCAGVAHDYAALYDSMGDTGFQIFNDAWAGQAPVNQPPAVSAGLDEGVSGLSASLLGEATDDGLPVPPGAVTVRWHMVSGPGRARFDNRNAAGTTVAVTAYGTYRFQLRGSDGERVSADDVIIVFTKR